jgi:hypothetical protein
VKLPNHDLEAGAEAAFGAHGTPIAARVPVHSRDWTMIALEAQEDRTTVECVLDRNDERWRRLRKLIRNHVMSHIKGLPINAFFVRKTAKERGARERIGGHLCAGAEVLIVDDVATTGGSRRRRSGQFGHA